MRLDNERECLQAAEKALVLNSRNYEALRLAASTRLGTGSYEKSKFWANKMIGMRPDEPDGYGVLAVVYFKQKNILLSQKNAWKAIECDSSYFDSYESMAQIHTAKGNSDSAAVYRQLCNYYKDLGSQPKKPKPH